MLRVTIPSKAKLQATIASESLIADSSVTDGASQIQDDSIVDAVQPDDEDEEMEGEDQEELIDDAEPEVEAEAEAEDEIVEDDADASKDSPETWI